MAVATLVASAMATLLDIPLHQDLGAVVRARLSGPSLIIGTITRPTGLVDAPRTLRTLKGLLSPSARRVASFDVGLPGLYMLEVLTIYREQPFDKPNTTQCTSRTAEPAFLGLLNIPRGRAGWLGFGARRIEAPRYVLSRVQLCHSPPHISPAPDPRKLKLFFTKVVSKIEGVTAATVEYGDRNAFEAFRYGATTSVALSSPPPPSKQQQKQQAAPPDAEAALAWQDPQGPLPPPSEQSPLDGVGFTLANLTITPRHDVCAVGDSMMLMICQYLPGCWEGQGGGWTRANWPGDKRAMGYKRPRRCKTLLISFGHHDLGWPNGYPTPIPEYQASLRALLHRHPSAHVLSVNYMPLNCIITTCPPLDWRTPPGVDAYNDATKAVVAEYRERGARFLDLSDIMAPVWDSANDWCHPRGHVAKVLAHRVDWLTRGPSL